jgi:hypothetical protein
MSHCISYNPSQSSGKKPELTDEVKLRMVVHHEEYRREINGNDAAFGSSRTTLRFERTVCSIVALAPFHLIPESNSPALESARRRWQRR